MTRVERIPEPDKRSGALSGKLARWVIVFLVALPVLFVILIVMVRAGVYSDFLFSAVALLVVLCLLGLCWKLQSR